MNGRTDETDTLLTHLFYPNLANTDADLVSPYGRQTKSHPLAQSLSMFDLLSMRDRRNTHPHEQDLSQFYIYIHTHTPGIIEST